MSEALRRAIMEVLADYQAQASVDLTRREVQVPSFPPGIRKALAFIGVRRSGKTFLMHQVAQDLVGDGVPKESMLHVNFEDDRLAGLTVRDLRLVADVQLEMFPVAAEGERHMFLDELQVVPGWERFARRMIDSPGVHVYVGGSSARMLAQEIATEMRGRCLPVEVSPFSFREFVRHMGEDPDGPPTTRRQASMQGLFRRFLSEGGFPETIGLAQPLRVQMLQDYAGVAVQRDVIERHDIRSPEPLRWLVGTLLGSASGLFSANKTYSAMKSQGRAISKDSIYSYMRYLEDAFLLFQVERYSDSANVRSANPRKVYAVDQGLVPAFSWRHALSTGALLENTVYCELRRRFSDIHYYRTSSGREVDFACADPSSGPCLFQACAELSADATLEREMDALLEAMRELRVRTGTVITLSEERIVRAEERTVTFIPAWKWMSANAPHAFTA